MPYKIRNPIAGNQQIAIVSDTQQHPLFTEVQAYDDVLGEGTFVYAKGAANTLVGSAVIVQSDGTTKLAVAGDVGEVAVAMGTTGAAQFGWYQRVGLAYVQTTAAVVNAAAAYLTATAGKIDDAVVAGDRVSNAFFAATGAAAGSVLTRIDRPFVDAALPT